MCSVPEELSDLVYRYALSLCDLDCLSVMFGQILIYFDLLYVFLL